MHPCRGLSQVIIVYPLVIAVALQTNNKQQHFHNVCLGLVLNFQGVMVVYL